MIDRVAELIREVSATEIEPRFTALRNGDIEEKSPGEVVTIVDRDAEARLAAGLTSIRPRVPVVGEEACHSDPAQLSAIGGDQAWLVDPLDGTANFVKGSPDFAVMVALLRAGETVMSWIWQPVTKRMFEAERGAGATVHGSVLRADAVPRPTDAADLRGAVLTRFLDPATAETVNRNTQRFGRITSGRMCSGYEYPSLVEGEEDFVLFWRTLPWDHAPGVLLVEEAGGLALRPDGARYRPSDEGVGLLVAADESTWRAASGLLSREPR